MGLGVQGLNREPRGVGGSVPAARRAGLERKTRRYRGGHGGGGGGGGRRGAAKAEGFGAGRQMGRSGPPWDRGEAGRPQSQAQQ